MSNLFQDRMGAPVTAKRAILSALSATGTTLSTSQLIQCGALFEVDAAAVRVALGRLVKNGDVAAVGRGVYGLGDKGKPIFNAIRRWIDLPNHTRPWDHRWVLVHTAHLGRTKRTALRRRERAMSFCGLVLLSGGLWLRPDNLRLDGAALRKRLMGLGLEEEALVITDAALAPDPVQRAVQLWDRQVLEASYRDALQTMEQCLERRDQVSTTQLAAQTAHIGSAVIGMLSFDPLLPAQLVDVGLRDAVHQQMLEFDRVGKEALVAVWK
mgnify:CR=1 FL=1